MSSNTGCSIAAETNFGPTVGSECYDGFDFTLVFEETILTIAPLSLLILYIPISIVKLWRTEHKVYEGWLNRLKLLLYGAYISLQLMMIIIQSSINVPTTKFSIPASAITLSSGLGFCLLSYLEHTRAPRPSGLLEFWFGLSLLFDIARTRTLWGIQDCRVVALLFTVTTVVKFILLLAESTEKRSLLTPEYRKLSPEATGNAWSRGLFWWLNSLLFSGFRRVLSLDMLFPIDRALIPDSDERGIKERWKRSNQNRNHTLLWIYARQYKWSLFSTVIPRLMSLGFKFAQPFLVERTLLFLTGPRSENKESIGYGLIGAYAIVYVGIAVSTAMAQHAQYRVITMARGTLISLIYQQTLLISASSLDQSAAVTLMSSDIERLGTGLRNLHELWACLIEISLAIWLLSGQLGWTIVASTVVIICCIVSAGFVAGKAGIRQRTWLENIQKRVGATADMLAAMKGVKMNGLTNILFNKITALRKTEIDSSRAFRELLIAIVSLAYSSTAMSPVAGFAVFVIMARKNGTRTLTTVTAFTCLALYELLASPVAVLIETFEGVMTAVSCFQRIQEYLTIPARPKSRMFLEKQSYGTSEHKEWQNRSHESYESEKTVVGTQRSAIQLQRLNLNKALPPRPISRSSKKDSCIGVRNLSVSYGDKKMVLDDLTFEIKCSQLTIIVGPVGSGKSTLLQALLGEIPISSGFIGITYCEAAYCGQSAWLTNDTIQENIVGACEFDVKWYHTVVRACALKPDFLQFPNGDQTIVGSGGTTLSGGQQMRISLARAVYSRKQVMILDDVLSGLDSSTEELVFNSLFGEKGLLYKNKTTVILVTNAVHRLPLSDHIIALGSNGKIIEQGTFAELNAWPDSYVKGLALSNRSHGATTEGGVAIPITEAASNPVDAEIEDMKRLTGDMTVYKYYIQTFGWVRWFIFVFLCGCYAFGAVFPQVWVKWWAAHNDKNPNDKFGLYIGVYATLGAAAVFSLMAICWHMVINIVPQAAHKLHQRLLSTVLNAPMSYFAMTDIGTTTNRFSQDLELVDMELPMALIQTAITAMVIIAQVLLMCFSTKYISATIPFCVLVVYVVQKFYLRTSRQLRLMDLEAKSPLFSRFLEALSGLQHIRAFGWSEHFLRRNAAALEDSQRPYYLLYCVQRWLNLVLDLTVAGIAVVLVIVTVETRGDIDAGLIGLALVNIVNFSANLKALVSFWTVLEASTGSVSRIRSFVDDTVSEHRGHEVFMPPPEWPMNGSLSINYLSVRYSGNQKPVINRLSLSVSPGQKIGICGRSGSGKSSLISSLFRMVEIDSGSIVIDGIDITSVPRQELRARLVAFPQEPYILNSTLRQNVDPYQQHSDEQIIEAVRKVQLWEVFFNEQGLETEIDRDLLSHGQRQLLCLARAILRPGSIVVLDECTSSVDVQTEAVMQELINKEFASRTVLAVAHRLDTIINYDKVAVIDHGELIEFDSPTALLNRPSAFKSLYATWKGLDITSPTILEEPELRLLSPRPCGNDTYMLSPVSPGGTGLSPFYRGPKQATFSPSYSSSYYSSKGGSLSPTSPRYRGGDRSPTSPGEFSSPNSPHGPIAPSGWLSPTSLRGETRPKMSARLNSMARSSVRYDSHGRKSTIDRGGFSRRQSTQPGSERDISIVDSELAGEVYWLLSQATMRRA